MCEEVVDASGFS